MFVNLAPDVPGTTNSGRHRLPFGVLSQLTQMAGFLGSRAHLYHTRVGFMVIALDVPAINSPKDPIWRACGGPALVFPQ